MTPASNRGRKPKLTQAGEFGALSRVLENRNSTLAQAGRMLERSVRLMETQEQEYVQAYIDVEHTTEGAIYVSEETTRMIVADAWSGIEEQIVEANAAFNAVADEPHERILAILTAARQITRYADIIYVLTPMPDEALED